MKFNAFEINGHNYLWFYISFINHNCRPNCTLFGFNELYNLRACVDIPRKGTEIFINYVVDFDIWEKSKTTDERKKDIEQKWGFNCRCDMCEKPTDTDRDFRRLTRLRDRRLHLEKGEALQLGKVKIRKRLDRYLNEYVELLKK